jgi:hypothetical protein
MKNREILPKGTWPIRDDNWGGKIGTCLDKWEAEQERLFLGSLQWKAKSSGSSCRVLKDILLFLQPANERLT